MAYQVSTEKGPAVTTSFQEFLRRRMFTGRFRLNVITEFKTRLGGMCADLNVRASMVQDTARAGVARKDHESQLPSTIYGGADEWSSHSSPGGDLRRRNMVTSVIGSAKELMQMIRDRNDDYVYDGNDLRADMIQVAKEAIDTCVVTYTNSAGAPVRLGLATVMARMHRFSFSPWHCPELRWGATSEKELATCPDIKNENKMRWYRAQQTLRNRTVRDTNIFTGFTLEQLEANSANLGPANPPNMKLIETMEREL